MKGNFFKCGNEVFIEGSSIGAVQDFRIEQERDVIADNCTFRIPLYAIGSIPGLTTEERLRRSLADAQIKVGASVRVEAWYYDMPLLDASYKRLVVFQGFIKEVQLGFPTTIVCEDLAFILRFGTIDKDWKARTALQDMINYLLPKANDAFQNFRNKQGIRNPSNFTRLTFDQSDSASVEFALKTFKQISPYDAIDKLINMFKLYGQVNSEGSVYVGIGIRNKKKRNVPLSTKENVIERKLVAKNDLFTNYRVEVSGVMKDGNRYTYVYGDSDGEPERRFCPLNTLEGIRQVAESVMANLRGVRNSGTIRTLLYPEIDIFDFIQYTDTLFSALSGQYYVIGRTLTMDEEGFTQTLKVTNEVFAL